MNDMKITSKYNVGDTVWFFESAQVKFFEGIISEVQSWDKWSGFRYNVKHVGQDGNEMDYNAEENKIFSSKNEILSNLFEENGTLTPTPAAEQPVA